MSSLRHLQAPGQFLLVAGAALLFTSCASSLPLNYYTPGIQIAGDFTVDDIRQITQLARSRPDIRKPVYEIRATGIGRAEATGGKIDDAPTPVTVFKVRKDNGRWQIIKGSVYQTTVFTLAHVVPIKR